MISCLHFKLCVTKIIRLPDGGYIRVQVHINPDCTQAVASLVRRERDSIREELGGGSNMKGSSFSELNPLPVSWNCVRLRIAQVI